MDRKDVFDRPTRTVEHVGAGPVTPVAATFDRNVLAVPLPDGRPYIEQVPLAYCTMCRQGDEMWPLANARQDGRFTVGVGFVNRLFRNGVEIPIDQLNGTVVPPEPGEFRAVWGGFAGTTAEWTWHSAGTATEGTTIPGVFCLGSHPLQGASTEPCRAEPAVFVSYEMGSTLSLDNTAAAGRAHTFTANAFHSLSTAAMPRIAGLKIWTSTDDGRTWVPAWVRGGRDGEFTVKARYPSLERTSGAVSLRAEAWDVAGNRVTMTSTRAFGLRAQPAWQAAQPI